MKMFSDFMNLTKLTIFRIFVSIVSISVKKPDKTDNFFGFCQFCQYFKRNEMISARFTDKILRSSIILSVLMTNDEFHAFAVMDGILCLDG